MQKTNFINAVFIVFVFLSILLAPSALQAQDEAFGGRDRFDVTVEELADGVYVMRREPSWRLPVQANTLVIVNEDDVVLVDGGFGAHAEVIVHEIRRITKKPVSVIINTHWHGDHNVGHYVFRREWPGAKIIAHANTRSAMADGAMDYVANTAAQTDEDLVGPLRERLTQLEAENAAPGLIRYTRDAITGLPIVRRDYAKWQMILADETFEKRLTLYRGGREIQLLYFGRANTEGDAIVWLPEERIVATGDVVVDPTPYGFGSYPASWAGVLERINALDYAMLVPGHGEVKLDKSHVNKLRDLMAAVAGQACAAIAAGGEDADAIHEAIEWASHEQAFTNGDPLLMRLFEVWFKRPISRGALNEIERGLRGEECN